MDIIDQFSAARDLLFETMRESLPVYFSTIFDPVSELIVERETCRIALDRVRSSFPTLPEQYLPQFRIRRSDESPECMDVMVQQYFCRSTGLKYLGTAGIDEELFDVYVRDPALLDELSIFVKFGHEPSDVLTGTERAYHEHSRGMYTPLAIAYQMILDENLI